MVVDSLVNGAVGGLVATVVMTAVMRAVGDGSGPPTADLVAKIAGGEPSEYKKPGMLLHLLYGVGAGAVFAAAYVLLSLPTGAAAYVGLGLAYGFVLFACGAVFWMKMVLGKDPGKQEVMVFLVVHLVYGGVLGGWLAADVL